MATVQGYVSDSELAAAFAGTNFGNAEPREIVAETLLKIAGEFSPGHTALVCCQELGLVGKNKHHPCLTKKGRRYLYYSHTPCHQTHPAPGIDMDLMRDAITKITKAAANLLTGDGFSSTYAEDHPKAMPKWCLRLLDSDEKKRILLARDIAQGLEWIRAARTAPQSKETAPPTPQEIYEFAYQKYGEHVVALRIPGKGGVQLFDTVKLFAKNSTLVEYERVKDEAAEFAKKFVAQFNRVAP